MTIAELHLGVLSASEPDVRARRRQALVFAERTFEPIPVSVTVARRFAELVAALRAEGRRAPIIDALIAATALTHGSFSTRATPSSPSSRASGPSFLP